MRMAWIALTMMIACGSWAQPPKSGGTSHKCPSEKRQIANTAQTCQYPAKESPLPVTIVASPDDAANTASREKAADKFNRDYLNSQIRLAVASEKQASAACAAAVIVGIETIIAGFALYFLRGTFLAARAQLRPKIIVRNISIEKANGKQTVLYALVNIGTGKGTIVDSWIMTEVAYGGAPVRNLRAYGHKDLGEPSFAVGQYYDFTYPVPEDQIGAPGTHGLDFYFTGAVRYIDEFGNSRNTLFRRVFWDGYFRGTTNPEHEYAD